MTTNQISATLTQTDRDAALTAIVTLKEKLPFLMDLTAENADRYRRWAIRVGRL
ncbi:MAG: hypothetical protein KME45_27170 [Stenomitos rutilans HA7619-LM2]|nr:hypothetical protein [Stenomitos rutilans HA7619-LM2]